MVVLVDFRIRLANSPAWAPSFDALAEKVELISVRQARELFPPECEIDIVVEEGSVKIAVKVLGALYLLVVGYGELRSGAIAMVQDATTLSAYVEKALSDRGASIQKVEVKPVFPQRLVRLLTSIDKASDSTLDEVKLEKTRAQLERLMSSVRTEEDRAFLLEHLPPIPPGLAPGLKEKSSLIEAVPASPPADQPPQAPVRSDDFPAIVDERRRQPPRRENAPRRERRRPVHRRTRIGLTKPEVARRERKGDASS